MALFIRSKPQPAADQTRQHPDAVTEIHASPTARDGAEGEPIPPADPAVEKRIFEIGRAFLSDARKRKAGFLTTQFWSDKLMDWAMRDDAFKVQLFRFVDTFPMLRTPEQVHDHLIDYLSQPGVKPPPFVNKGLQAGSMAKGMVTKTMASQIRSMGEKFIAGTNAAEALPKLKTYWDKGIAFSVDLLGEACVSDAEAEAYQQRYLDLINNLPDTVNSWPANETLETDHLGPIPRTNVSIKISSLYARTDPMHFDASIEGLMNALGPILTEAGKRNVFINFDMEQESLKDLTLALFMRACEEYDFPAGLAMQAYLRSGDDDARRIIDWSRRTGRQVTVRLVKGAYWDYETIHAEQHSWPIPVWSRKIDTDACFERMTRQFIEAIPRDTNEGGVKLALGSHNVRSIAVAMALIEKHKLPMNALELQMLHGMADELKTAAVDRGMRVREYVPVGEMIPGMAYLVRRLLENTSNESWLKAGFLEDKNADELLTSPHKRFADDPGRRHIAEAPERHQLGPAVEGVGDGRPFYSEPHRDFTRQRQRENFANAVQNTKVPHVKNDSTVDDAKRAIEQAHEAFPAWRDMEPVKRARILTDAAQIMRDQRDELSAIVLKESGKRWRGADADVCEAIDFIEYYARHSVKLFQPERLGKFIGEYDAQWYQPRGVAAIISPWNFPLAICTGMTSASLVTGNTAVVKPAEQTPGIAKRMCEIMWEAGVPREVLHFVPGEGETVGAELVRDPRIAIIAFTGSKAVGLDIIKAAGHTPEEQPFVKKVVCEMGGKNAIVVDASADLDEAVLATRDSAFVYQGQKCSACSRAIVVDSCHDWFLERLVESTRSLTIGDPADPNTDIAHVIDEEAHKKITSYIEVGKQEGQLELAMDVPDGLAERVGRPYVGPHIFSGITREHRLANEEIFGPVLSVMRVNDFDEALAVANESPYKLTGGAFSRKPSHLERAKREFRVGNLYLNRDITGSLIGRQPFGGFGMSGVGSKAGGKDYLLQFVEPRCVAENTMRRGFAPGL